MKSIKKIAIISAMVLMISIIPAFALNETNKTNEHRIQIKLLTPQ